MMPGSPVVLQLLNGWTVSIAPEPQAGHPQRRSVAAWPTSDDSKPVAERRWYWDGGDRRAWSIEDLVELLDEIAVAEPPGE